NRRVGAVEAGGTGAGEVREIRFRQLPWTTVAQVDCAPPVGTPPDCRLAWVPAEAFPLAVEVVIGPAVLPKAPPETTPGIVKPAPVGPALATVAEAMKEEIEAINELSWPACWEKDGDLSKLAEVSKSCARLARSWGESGLAAITMLEEGERFVVFGWVV